MRVLCDPNNGFRANSDRFWVDIAIKLYVKHRVTIFEQTEEPGHHDGTDTDDLADPSAVKFNHSSDADIFLLHASIYGGFPKIISGV